MVDLYACTGSLRCTRMHVYNCSSHCKARKKRSENWRDTHDSWSVSLSLPSTLIHSHSSFASTLLKLRSKTHKHLKENKLAHPMLFSSCHRGLVPVSQPLNHRGLVPVSQPLNHRGLVPIPHRLNHRGLVPIPHRLNHHASVTRFFWRRNMHD